MGSFGKSPQNKEQWGAFPSVNVVMKGRELITSMTGPLFPSRIGTQSRFARFLSIKTVARKFAKGDRQTVCQCLDKAVLAGVEGCMH